MDLSKKVKVAIVSSAAILLFITVVSLSRAFELPPGSPLLEIVSPASGTNVTVGTTITITASSTDDVAVDRVEFTANLVPLCTDTTAPYTCDWTAPNTLGTTSIRAISYDNNGHSSFPRTIILNAVDPVPPTVSITSPLNGSKVTANSVFSITATASDNVAVSKVEFYVNNVLICTDTTAPYSCGWSVPRKTGLSYTLQAKAYDTSNNVGTSPAVVVTSKR